MHEITKLLDVSRPTLTAEILEGLDAVHSDEMLLLPECESQRALKLLNKQAASR